MIAYNTGLRRISGLAAKTAVVISRSASTGKKHFERKLIKQPISALYEVVSDVDRYKEFVPWCKESRVVSKSGKHMTADLEVGFNIFSEKYTSKIEVLEPTFVSAVSTQTNLFEYLRTEWKFTPASDPSTTWVTFQVEFKFRSAMYNELSRLFLQEVIAKMVNAFEQRCKTVRLEQKESTIVDSKYTAAANSC
jgi:ribosome-associated toxin RatA of RatAB toxin-antitoxin module